MGKGKRLLLLLALLLAAIGVYVGLSRSGEEDAAPEGPETDFTAAAIPSDTVTALSWENAARTISFQRTDGIWTCTSDKRHPTDEDSVRFDNMLQALSDVTATRYIEDVSDISEYGLDLPQTVISVTQADGNVTQFTIGDQNPVVGDYYLQVSGDGGVYLIDSKLPDAFSFGLFDLLEFDILPDVSGATEYKLDKTTYYFVEQADTGESLWCLQKNGGYQPIDTEQSRNLTNALKAIQWTACIDYYADSDEVRSYEYNLEKGRLITITDPDENGTPATYQLVVGNSYDADHTVVSPLDSNLVYSMENSLINALLLQ